MPLIALEAKFDKPAMVKALGREWGAVKKHALAETARFWLQEMFPEHFQSGNQSKYKHEPRNKFYKSVIKRMEGVGEGKTVELILGGQSRRWLRSSARVTSTQHRATLYMSGPSYFANPKIGRVSKEIKTKSGGNRTITIDIRRQPNKVAELTRLNDQDRRKIQRFLESNIGAGVRRAMLT